MSDDGDLFGFALGLGETKPIDRNEESNVESRNYSFSTYENLIIVLMPYNIFLEFLS